jgi:hypothetical protein
MLRNLRSKFNLEKMLPDTIYKKMQLIALLIWQQNIYDCKKNGVTRRCCTLHFLEWLSLSGHQRGWWYLSSPLSKFSSRDGLAHLSWGGIGPMRWNTKTFLGSCFRGPHSGQLLTLGNRLILEFQQCLKKGQCQWSCESSCFFKLFLVRCSYSSSSDSYWWRCRY